MKSIGIVRKMDNLGRVVIPKELRKIMDIPVKSPLEVFVDGDKIIFTKYNPGCTICGNMEEVLEWKNKNVCKDCLTEMSELSN